MKSRTGGWRTARWLRECERVGADPLVRGRPTGESYGGTIRIGDRFRLASRPVPSHMVAGQGARLVVGDDVSIGHGAAISAFERVEIGDGTRIGPFVIIMDTNFHGAAGDQSVRHETRPIAIGRNCRIGSRVTITRGVTIGDGVTVEAGSVVSASLPDFVRAGGAKARVLGEARDRSAGWGGSRYTAAAAVQEALDLAEWPVLDTRLPEMSPRDRARLASALFSHAGVAVDAGALADTIDVRAVAAVIEAALPRGGADANR